MPTRGPRYDLFTDTGRTSNDGEVVSRLSWLLVMSGDAVSIPRSLGESRDGKAELIE